MTARVFVSLARTPNERPHELMIFLSESNISRRTNERTNERRRKERERRIVTRRLRWTGWARAAPLPSPLAAPACLPCAAPVFWTMSTTRLKGLIEKMKSRRQAETDRDSATGAGTEQRSDRRTKSPRNVVG